MEMLSKISGIESAVAEIATGLSARKEQLVKDLSPYINGVVTESTLKEWKKDRARINADKASTKKERTTLESMWKEKLLPISEAYKEMDSISQLAIDNIDNQVKAFDNSRKALKVSEIKKLIESIEFDKEIEGWFLFEDLFNEKWLNVTYKMDDIEAEVREVYRNAKREYDIIKCLNNEWEEQGIEELKKTKSLEKAIAKMNLLSEQAKIIEKKASVKQEELSFEECMNAPVTEVSFIVSTDFLEKVEELLEANKIPYKEVFNG